MVVFTDSDWAANDTDHARAVTGYVLFMLGAAISWISAFRMVGLSTCEVQYYGMGAIAAETLAHTITCWQHVFSAENCADMMVKALPKAGIRKHRATCFGPYVAPAVVLSIAEQLTAKMQASV